MMRVAAGLPVLILVFLTIPAAGQGDAAAPGAYPALAALDHDLQELYRQVEPSLARVLVPNLFVARLNPDHPLSKWGPQLDEQVRRELLEGVRRDIAKTVDIDRPGPASQPGDPAATQVRQAEDAFYDPKDPSTVVVTGGERDVAEQIAFVFDDAGHIVVPAIIDKRVAAQRPLRVTVGQHLVGATLVGSDARTQLSVLRLDRPLGSPMLLARASPTPGSMVLLLAPMRRSAQVGWWTGRIDEPAVVLGADGSLIGFSQPGHMLHARHIRTMVEQIIRRGQVERSVIGAMIGEIALGDPIRQQEPALGARSALQVLRVVPGSPAAAAGLVRGDIILTMGNEPAPDLFGFAAMLCTMRGPTPLEIVRQGKVMQITVDLQPQP
jgi:hypothetical protein